MKTLSLLKAILSNDMNIFKYSTKRNSSKLIKLIFPLILFIIVAISIGNYAYMFGEKLAPFHLTYVMLSMFIMMVTILTFIEGIYKSQGILFEAKDNDLLFSLPIKKYQILSLRIVKLLLFQYLYNLMFLLPAFVIYIYFEHPSINFYLMSLLMMIMIPIIPTVISSFLGYIIKLFSSKVKSKKFIQALLSSIIFLGIFYVSMNLNDFIKNIVSNANSINDVLIKIYYPIGLYNNLIFDFNFSDLLKLFMINIIPFVIFILLGQRYYFNIISNSNGKSTSNKSNYVVVKRSKINSLVRKELRRYFSSVVYMFNTSFGLLLCVIVSVLLCLKGKSVFDTILTNYKISYNLSLSVLYYFFILFVGSFTSITSSSISLEGSTINITKSLPVSEKDILKSKIITCYVIELPFMILSDIIFIIKFRPSYIYICSILLLSLMTILLSACIGLIANLKYPKMNASSDTEVVKQSMSSMISVFIGMGIFVGSILLIMFLNKYINIDLLVLLHLSLVTIIALILYVVLIKFGVNDYRKINV